MGHACISRQVASAAKQFALRRDLLVHYLRKRRERPKSYTNCSVLMKSLLLFVLTCLASVAVFLTVTASVFLIAGMAVFVAVRRLLGFSRPVAA